MITLKGLTIKGEIRKGFKDGTSKVADRTCYGYTKSKDGSLTIIESEAGTACWIFECYLGGESLGKIADSLTAQGIPSPTGNAKWNRQTIDKLLSNEKYVGCALLQKTVTENGRQVRNYGQDSRYLYQNNNPAIISTSTFKTVQEEKRKCSRCLEKASAQDWIMSLK